jgi:hypothetical protein
MTDLQLLYFFQKIFYLEKVYNNTIQHVYQLCKVIRFCGTIKRSCPFEPSVLMNFDGYIEFLFN